LKLATFTRTFIVWLLLPERQYITFVDPKGIRNLQGANDPKIGSTQQLRG